MADDSTPGGQILIYRDGETRLQVRLDGHTVWLSQRLIAELFQVSVPTVNEHLAGIYDDGELDREATIRSFRIVQREGERDVARNIEHYNLEAILAVGYRVRSARGTAFRQWATTRLSELLVKGFTLDDERIKAGRTLGDDYFDELLERIRDIRVRIVSRRQGETKSPWGRGLHFKRHDRSLCTRHRVHTAVRLLASGVLLAFP